MVLGEGLIDKDGHGHRMAGLLPVETSFAEPRLHLGYRQLSLAGDGILGNKNATFRGHEFHYASLVKMSGEPLFEVQDARDETLPPAGVRAGNVAGSFLHLLDRI